MGGISNMSKMLEAKKEVDKIKSKYVHLDGDSEVASTKLLMKFISEVVAARNACGYTQKQLSELSGIPTFRISEFESGKKFITIRNVVRLLYAMGKRVEIVPIDDKLREEIGDCVEQDIDTESDMEREIKKCLDECLIKT